MKFHYVIWNQHRPTEPVFFIRKLFKLRGWSFRIHKFVAADDRGCFHSHPAVAYRLILWGGYVEQTRDGKFKHWKRGMFGKITPEFEHRIDSLVNRKYSYSLWIRGPITHDVNTTGC